MSGTCKLFAGEIFIANPRSNSTADYVICIRCAGANESQGSYIGQIVNATSSEELLFP